MKLKHDRRVELVAMLDLATEQAVKVVQSGEGEPLNQAEAHAVLIAHIKLRLAMDKQARSEVRLKRAEMVPGEDNLVINCISQVCYGSEIVSSEDDEPEQSDPLL